MSGHVQSSLRDEPNMHRASHWGFTLVELLVVISIIAILIAMLLPSLKNARKRAMEMKEISFMRQMGMANASYAAEHKACLVLYGDGWFSSNYIKKYPLKIASYMNFRFPGDQTQVEKRATQKMVCSDDSSNNSISGNWPSFFWQVPMRYAVPLENCPAYYSVGAEQSDPYHIKTKYDDGWIMNGIRWPTQDRIKQPSYQVLIRCPAQYLGMNQSGPKYSHDQMRGVIYFDNHGDRRHIIPKQ